MVEILLVKPAIEEQILNDVYKSLGIERTKINQVTGYRPVENVIKAEEITIDYYPFCEE